MKIIALFHAKLKLGVDGRKQTFEILNSQISDTDKTLWFHCASLGEYEQGLPVFEGIKSMHPDHKVVLSFFSPSGYEIRKNAPVADVVVYLPLDTKKNARSLLNAIHPELIVFVKYEIWPNYLLEIKKQNLRAILISAVFRKEQPYFKSHSRWMLNALKAFDHIFVQNEASKKLISEYGFQNVSVSGDTRFDRVSQQLEADNTLDFIQTFKGDSLCLVAGSTWPEDEKILVEYINTTQHNIKFIIAPHNIKMSQISHLKNSLKKNVVLFSEMAESELAAADVLILDTIGLLSKTFSYADLAYIGGAVGQTGLHNTLEPAVFGLPILIGHNYQNFPEAHEMINHGGMISIKHQSELNTTLNKLILNESERQALGKKNSDFIHNNEGAVIQILDYIRKY